MREALTFPALQQAIARIGETQSVRRIAIPVETPHQTIGALPTVEVTQIQCGIDWDSGTLFIYPAKPLTALTSEDVADMRKARKDGHSYAMQKAHERWNIEKGDLVDTINKLRTALLQKGMSSADLEDLAGAAPTMRVRRQK